MRVENVNYASNISFTANSSKSLFKRFTSMFSRKKDSAKAFEAVAASTSAAAIAGIEIKKKEYIEPKIIIKERQKTLDEIIPDLPEISDEEYRKLEKKVRSDENYEKMFWGYMYTNPYETMGKRETQLSYKILKIEELLANRNVKNYAKRMMFSSFYHLNDKQAKVINYILDNPKLYNDEDLLTDAWHAMQFIGKSNVNYVLKLLSDDRLRNTYLKCGSEELLKSRTSGKPNEVLTAMNNMVDKFLSNKNLYENKNLQDEIFHITYRTDNNQDYVRKSKLLDKYLGNENLINSHVSDCIGDMLLCVENDMQYELAQKILDTPKLYKNKALFGSSRDKGENIRWVLCNAKTPEKSKSMNEMLDLFLSEEKLYKNQNMNASLARILATTDECSLNYRKMLLQKYLTNEDLQNSSASYRLGYFFANTSWNREFKIVDKIFSEVRLYKNDELTKAVPKYLLDLKGDEDADFILKLLDKDEILKDNAILRSISDLQWLINFGTDDAKELKLKLLNKILDNKDLCSDKSFMLGLSSLIGDLNYDGQYEIAEKVLDNPKYYNNKTIRNKLSEWMSKMDGIGSPNMEIYKSLKILLDK